MPINDYKEHKSFNGFKSNLTGILDIKQLKGTSNGPAIDKYYFNLEFLECKVTKVITRY